MSGNPFSSEIYTREWARHFGGEKRSHTFGLIEGVQFIKHPSLPYYFNLGHTHTKGIKYVLHPEPNNKASGKTFLIYDVPDYSVVPIGHSAIVKRYRIRQYPGYSLKMDAMDSLDEYLLAGFSSKTRNKLRGYIKKMESDFEVTYTMYYGEIARSVYDDLLNHMKRLMEKRFAGKKEFNNNLDPQEWAFYEDVFFPLILTKQASLFVTYCNGEPVGMMLNYMSDSRLLGAMTVFDTDLYQYSVGSVSIMKQIDWCLQNNIRILDFSKGDFDYKRRWSNFSYHYEYHILFDPTSFVSVSVAFVLKLAYSLKFFLRNLGLSHWLNRVRFAFYKGHRTNSA